MLQTIVFKGYSGSGKTHLIEYFMEQLTARGYNVSIVDHQTKLYSEDIVKEIIGKHLVEEPDFLLIGLASDGRLEIHFEEYSQNNVKACPPAIEFLNALNGTKKF